MTTNTNEPMEMALCEQDFVFLRPNQLYVFRVNPNCDRCKEIAAMHEYPNPNGKTK